MLRFNRNSDQAPNYFARGHQLRLLLLVFSLGLVLLVMSEVRKAQRWTWLWRLDESSPAPAHAVGSVTARLGKPPAQRPRDAGRTRPIASGPDTADHAPPVASPREYFPGVDPSRLEPIEDHSLFRRREREAWFHLIDVLLSQTSEQLRQASEGTVGFAQLYHEPGHYRGRLVTLQGEVRRTEFVDAPKNPSGVKGYHRLTMRLAGGPSRPVVVFSLSIPKGFPQGNDVRESITVTGFFFKNCAYPTQDDVYSFPTLLAKSIDRNGNNSEGLSAAFPVETDAGSSAAAVVEDAAVANVDDAPATPDHAGEGDLRDTFGSILELVGVGPDERRRMAQHDWLDSDTLPYVLDTLYHLRRFEESELRKWVDAKWVPAKVARASGALPVRLYAIAGRLQSVQPHAVPEYLAARLQLSTVYACQVNLGTSSWPAELLVADVPRSLRRDGTLKEQVAATGLLIRVEPVAEQRPRLVFVADRLKWHPDMVDPELGVSHGMTVLGALRMDVGLWDTVRSRRPLEAGDRECFFQLLDAAQRAGARRLERAFRRQLPERVRRWEREAARLEARLGDQGRVVSGSSAHDRLRSGRNRLTALREQIARAERGLSSVVPLFNQPQESRGSLVVLEGTARRAVRIHSDRSPPSDSSEAESRFGVDAYYELDVFTEDSQNNPVVLCTRSIPVGFPEGDQIQERIRATGFMFKAWAYAAEAGDAPAEGGEAPSKRWRIAPLIVAPTATWIREKSVSPSTDWQWWGGGLFVLAMAAAWVGLAVYQRGDRRFQREVLERQRRPPENAGLAANPFSVLDSDAPGGPPQRPEAESAEPE